MAIKTIDAGLLKDMFLAGAKNIEAHKEHINELNVFPVPDGDTGTNMTMTVMSAVREVEALEEISLKTLSKAMSSGALRGARGNSGVILSQLFRGFTSIIKTSETIDNQTALAAFSKASETAYKAVMKPKEGTILTVAKGMSDKAADILGESEDLAEALRQIIEYGDYVLSITPEMLPVLKEAGVVDSGGEGLMDFMHGAYMCMTGEKRPEDYAEAATAKAAGEDGAENSGNVQHGPVTPPRKSVKEGGVFKNIYCTDFVLKLTGSFSSNEEEKLSGYFTAAGESVSFIPEGNTVKIHLHTDAPGMALTKAQKYGTLSAVSIVNLTEEGVRCAHEQKAKAAAPVSKPAAPAKPPKENGFIAVSVGEGIKSIFTELGVDYVVEGGQTMNPSTEDIMNAIEQVNARNIYVFPNNKNVILAAQQAASLTEDKNILIVPTRNVPQGITAMINYIEENSTEDNFRHMTESIDSVKTCEITYAIRDTSIDNIEIHQGNIMAIGDKGLLAVGEDIEETALKAIEAMVDDSSEVVSIYSGKDVEDSKAEEFLNQVVEKYPDMEIDLNNGGQPVYYYIISVE
ncbi:MAG: DAK2 domain-containing protein [Lachnospiraceae bacterium]|nr:DAK2 domain-containing protein [Lachnospiraceae bacterium]